MRHVLIGGLLVRGVNVDAQSRCDHYESEFDVVAIKFACCETYYSCHLCHGELAGHSPVPIAAGHFDNPAVLCGVCGSELTVKEYLDCGSKCPHCGAAFNPRCEGHYHLYFEGG